MDRWVGQTLDRYQISSQLGSGRLGPIFKARDLKLERDVAVKLVEPDLARQPGFEERFLQEARTAARLDHPGVVRVFDFAQADALFYIVMDFIPGDSLQQMMRRFWVAKEWFELTEALHLVYEVSQTVAYTHQQGVLHRSVEPHDIILKAEPGETLPYRPVLTDLGLAKLHPDGLSPRDEMSLIQLAFLSPEQVLNGSMDARSDVYGLGVLLYLLTVGEPPLKAKTVADAARYHTQGAPPPPRSLRPEVPEAVEQTILKALARHPAARFSSVEALAGALLELLPHRPEVAATILPPEENEFAAPGPVGPVDLSDSPPTPSPDRILVREPDGAVRPVPFQGERLTIGRHSENDLTLNYPEISRHHARIEFDGANYYVTDLESTSGTYLDEVKLLSNRPVRWEPGQQLHIGEAVLYLERPQSAPSKSLARSERTITESGLTVVRPDAERLRILMETPELSVVPGHSVTASIYVLNQTGAADQFEVSVRGMPKMWLQTPPPIIHLLPGAQQEVKLTFQPPRRPDSEIGRYAFRIRVVSQNDPETEVEVGGGLTVAPFAQFHCELDPQKVRTGQPAQVTVENQGNAPQIFTLRWRDRADELAFEPPHTRVTVPPGQAATVDFHAVPHRQRWVGREKGHTFSVQVRSPEGEIQMRQGELVSRAIVPTWVVLLIGIPLLAACALLGGLFFRAPLIRSITIDPPNPVVGQPLTIRWQVLNAQRVELRPLVSDLDPAVGRYTFTPELIGPTQLTFVASNRYGETERLISFNIGAVTPTPTSEPDTPVIEEWTVFPTSVTRGQAVTIRWRVTNADSITLQPFGTVNETGERTDTPQENKTYTLIANNQGKTVEQSQEVIVATPLPGAPLIRVFTVDPSFLVSGAANSVRLSWEVENADTVVIEPGIGVVTLVGSRDVAAPASDISYTLTARNAGGETRAQVPIRVVTPTPTATSTQTPTLTPTPTGTLTPTSTGTTTSTPTSTGTVTPTPTGTLTSTPTGTFTPTPTGTFTPTPTGTGTLTPTPTDTLTLTPTSTVTGTVEAGTATATP